MYADPTLMDLAAAYAKRRNGRKTKHAVACDRPGAKAKNAVHAGVLAQAQANVRRAEKDYAEAKERLEAMIRYDHPEARIAQAERGVELAEKRLEEAEKALRSLHSRPGAKAKMGLGTYKEGDRTVSVDGRKYEVLPYQVDFFLADLGKQDDAAWRASVVKHYLRKGYIKATASRPGAKEEMGRAEQVMRDGSVHLDFRAAKEWLSSVTDDALRYIISDSQKAAKAMPDGNKWNYYHDLSLTAQDELQRRKSKSSRPGAKSTHAAPMSASVLLDYAMRAESRGDKAAAKNWTKQLAEAISAGEKLGGGQMRDADKLRSKYGFSKSTHAALPPQTLEAERKPGGGSHSEAVSRKIATLINEGKPQDQAVAIALDLERRGEL